VSAQSWRGILLVTVILAAILPVSPAPSGSEQESDPIATPRVPGGFFLENAGQIANDEVRYYATLNAFSVGFAESSLALSLRNEGLLRMRFEGSNPVDPEGRDELPHRTNFFLGADPTGWRTDVRSYGELAYSDLYEGIELVYRMDARGPKYEFRVEAGADESNIRMTYEGARAVDVDASETLVVRSSLGEVRDTAPIAHQAGTAIRCGFDLRAAASVGFSCPARDPDQPLVIDPLIYATFLGGAGNDQGRAIAVDAAGYAYVAGFTQSANFPTTAGAANTSYGGGFEDAFVAKYDQTGTVLLYATYLGGSGEDEALAIAASGGSAYVTGQTTSPDFPTTTGAMDRQQNSTDGFVVKLSPAGDVLVYATFLGGEFEEAGESIEADPAGSAYVTGITTSLDFPTTPGAMNESFNGGFSDAFLVKVNPAGSALIFGTYFGGSVSASIPIDLGWDLAVDGSGSAYVVGVTNSLDFPTTPGAFNRTLQGGDAFVARFTADGSGLLYSTFLGGSGGDSALSVGIDGAGSAYVTGFTDSGDFPVTLGAFNLTYGGASDAFVAKLTPAGDALAYATYLGSAREDVANGIAVDASGRATVSGYTNSTNFPTTPWATNATRLGGVYDAFVVRLNAAGSGLVYSTYFGGRGTDLQYGFAMDPSGNAYVTGITNSSNFPVTPGAPNATYAGGPFDAYVAKLNLTVPLAFDSVPSGLQIDVNGSPRGTPFTYGCEPGSTATVGAPSPQIAFQTRWDFLSWSDGGARSHAVLCDAPRSLTAQFVGSEFEITVDTSPTGLFVFVDGATRNTPHLFWCVAGSVRTIDVPTPQVAGSTRYVFASWSDGGPRLHGIPCNGPRTYVASFTTEYLTNVTTSPPNRAVVVDGVTLTAPQSFWWGAGSVHSLDVPSPQTAGSTRYAFSTWSDGGAQAHTAIASGPQTFTAGFSVQYDTIVTSLPIGLQILVDGVAYTSPRAFWCDEGSAHGIEAPSPQGAGPIRNVFSTWSDGGARAHGIVCGAPQTLTADFGREYEMRLDTLPGGLALELDGGPVTAPHVFWCTADAFRTVSAPTPQVAGATRASFLAWSDGGARTHSVLCDQPSTFTALFVTEHRVDLSTTPVDLDLLVDGSPVTAPASVWWAEGSTHTVSLPTPQYPGGPTATRYAFRRWSDGQPAATRTITVSGPLALAAEFEAEHPIVLDSTPSGLRVVVDGLSLAMPQTLWWPNGTVHTLTVATPQPGTPGVRYAFSAWSDGGPASRAITATAPLALTATFTTQYLLSLTSPYGTPWCDNADCWYDAGITAAFGVDNLVSGGPGVRYAFRIWTGDLTSTALVTAIRMDGPKSETAEWRTQYHLQVVSPFGNVTGGDWYEAGETAAFSVVAREVVVEGTRYRFIRWTGAVNTTATNGTVVMDGPRTVVAQWERLAFYDTPIVWLVPVLVALLLLVFLLWRRRRKPEPEEPPEKEEASTAEREAEAALSDLEHEVDLDGGPER